MENDERLNVQIKKKLVLELKDLSVRLTTETGKMVPMQTLADKAISNFLKKHKKGGK